MERRGASTRHDVLAGRIALGSGDPAAKPVTVDWTGDERHTLDAAEIVHPLTLRMTP
jgi:hypothetical protein